MITPEENQPPRCQSKVHAEDEDPPPVAKGTYDLEWDTLDENGEPGGLTGTAVRRLCRECRGAALDRGVLVTPHRLP